LLFGLDLDDFHLAGEVFLVHDLAKALKCKVVRRTVFVIKEAHSHEIPPNSALRAFSCTFIPHTGDAYA